MTATNEKIILNKIRSNLNRNLELPVPSIPPPLPPRQIEGLEFEIDSLIKEINLVSGNARRMTPADLNGSLTSLVKSEEIKKAFLWDTPYLNILKLKDALEKIGVEIISLESSKKDLAECDLGITEVDFALSETGTICLLSDEKKPRTTSLLPRVHLAIIKPEDFRPDLHQVLEESKGEAYLVFITGPSRTADIELTVALGVHGPKQLYVWVIV